MMTAVAVAGMVSAWGVLWWRACEYQRRADAFRLAALASRNNAMEIRYFRLADKSRVAMDYPWLPVAPDPPEPV